MARFGLEVAGNIEEADALRAIEDVNAALETNEAALDPPLTDRQQKELRAFRQRQWDSLLNADIGESNPNVDRWTHAVSVASALSPAVMSSNEAETIDQFLAKAAGKDNALRTALADFRQRLASGQAGRMEATSLVIRARLQRLGELFEANLPTIDAMVRHKVRRVGRREAAKPSWRPRRPAE